MVILLRIKFTSYGNIQLATATGLETFEYQPGETAEVPNDVAALFIDAGVAAPVTTERATKPKGETATK